MTDPRESSREKMLAQLERCANGQRYWDTITPPDVPRADDWCPGSTECIPEEPMGHGGPVEELPMYEGGWA